MVPDMSLMQPYLDVFKEIDEWQALEEPEAGGYSQDRQQDSPARGHRSRWTLAAGHVLETVTTYDNEEDLEATLQAAVRIALEYRLDLMNTRAQLYDAWRQIRFRANALKGIFNVALTNQIFTPPTTTNPFAFFSQAKQFSLVLNAELPLIRVNERNNFRQAIIAYQQAAACAPEPGRLHQEPVAWRHPSDAGITIFKYRDHQAEPDLEHPAQGPGLRADHRSAPGGGRHPEPGPIGQRGDADHEPDRLPEHLDSRARSL